MTKNQIAFLELQETKRANQAREAETYRSNLAQESLTAYRDTNAVQQRDREIAETMRSNLAREAETQRSNIARETETYRSNIARETETNRHNIVNEGIDQIKARAASTQASAALRQAAAAEYGVQLRGMELASLNQYRNATLYQEQQRIDETNRSNVAREREQRRHNVVSEAAERTRLSQEDTRISQEQQKIGQNQQRIDIDQQRTDIQYKTLREQRKHNRAQETIGFWNAVNGTLSSLSKFTD